MHAEKEDECYANEGARLKNEKRGKSRYVHMKIAVYRRRYEEKKGVKQGKVVTVVDRHNEITVNNNENDRNKNKDRQHESPSPMGSFNFNNLFLPFIIYNSFNFFISEI